MPLPPKELTHFTPLTKDYAFGLFLITDLENEVFRKGYLNSFFKKEHGFHFRIEIYKANFHCLRHTFATRALEEGISAKTVNEILGHANVSTTLDLYSHVLPETKRNAIERMIKFIEMSRLREFLFHKNSRNRRRKNSPLYLAGACTPAEYKRKYPRL